MDAVIVAAIASALSDVTRARVLGLADGRHGIAEIAAEVGVSSSAVSYHVGRLVEAGIVEVVRRGRRHQPRRVRDAEVLLLRALA